MLSPGVYPASITPFLKDGSIDELSAVKLWHGFHSAECRGALCCGTTGEAPSLSAVERRDLARLLGSQAPGEKFFGTASASVSEVEWLLSQAAKAGVDAALVLPPTSLKPYHREGVLSWYERIADESPIDIILYNIPQLTGFEFMPEDLVRLSRYERVAGLKDSSGVEANLETFRSAWPSGMLYVGAAHLQLDALRSGWDGAILAIANLVPDWCAAIDSDNRQGRFESADEKFRALAPVRAAVAELGIPGIVSAMHELGRIPNGLPRLPLVYAEPTPIIKSLQSLGVRAQV